MKVKFNRAALVEALGLVTSVVPSRTPKAILQCIKITAKDDIINICATDLEAGISLQVAQAEISEPGEIVVPADKFSSIVRESLDDVVAVEASEATISIRGADSHFTIYGHEPNQYPIVPGFDGKADLVVGLDKLQDGIELTLFAAAKESSRYAINGVLWEIQGKKMTLVSTDGRRLAKAVVDLDKPVAESLTSNRVIVPVKAMSLLDRVAGSEKDTVAVKFVDNKIIMTSGTVVVSSNLVEGNFPKYEEIIPKENDKKITLLTSAALSAVRRAALLTNEDSKGVKLALSEGKLVLTCRAPETGDAQIDMTVDYKGESLEIGFNPQFLIDALRVLKTDNCSLELGQSDRPGLMKSEPNFMYVIMPVNLG